MTKKLVLVATFIAAIAIALVAGFTLFMAGREEVWKAQQTVITQQMMAVSSAAQLARNYFPLITLALIIGIFGVAWLIGILFRKK